MGRPDPGPNPEAPPSGPALPALPALIGLVLGLSQAWPELPAPTLEPGLRSSAGLLPALRLSPKGAPEVLIAWIDRGVREQAISAWLSGHVLDGLGEVFLFDPAASGLVPGLLGYVLDIGGMTAIPNHDGALESKALGLLLRAEGPRLRVLLADGEAIPFPEELAGQLERARAEASRWRQKAERREGELNRARAEVDRQKQRAEAWKSEAARRGRALGEAGLAEDATAEITLPERRED